MRIFKNAWFERFARKEGISDTALIQAIVRADYGLIDANLGSGVIKQRVARPGQGRSAGWRTIVLYRARQRAFFVYGFSKSRRANIEADEEAVFRKAASYVLGLSDWYLTELMIKGKFLEIDHGEEVSE
ncbi:type II toxin-antitoxin system RelE/ParE family toxin [Alcaligenaceae bacterium]|nr:type II toxin-antitoxin system RelE/ParE family toxin [Alcaligenaceae bacterium]